MSEISANFVVEQLQSRLEVTQNEITFTPEPVQLRLSVGTNKINSPGGPNTAVQFNDAGSLGGTLGLTFNKTSNTFVVGSGSTGNIIGANVISANTFTGNFVGNGSGLSSITGANVTGNVPNATFATSAASATTAATVTTAAQPNITSTGILNSLSYYNASSVNGIYIQGGSNAGAHVSSMVNFIGSDNGLNFTVYGNAYSAGSWFGVGANGSAITSNTTSPFGIGTSQNQPLLLGTNGIARARITTGGSLAVNTQIARGNISIGRDTAASTESHTLHFGYTPLDYYGFRFNNTNNPSGEAAGNLVIERGTTLGWSNVITINNVGAVTVATPALGNALTVNGNVHANGFSSPTAASAATDTTITYKLPIVLNGVTYWIALTTNQ